MKKVLIAGASGMVGTIILNESLKSDKVRKVVSLVRRPSGLNDSKLLEVLVEGFTDFSQHQDAFENVDAAHFCIGVYTGAVPDDQFKKITVDYAVKFAEALKNNSPNANICLLSGTGADRQEKSRTAFAKYKGMAENAISAMDMNFHAFRPAYIYPVEKRKEPNAMYSITRALYPLIKLFGKNSSIKSTELGQAMFKAGIEGASEEVMENKEILQFLEG
ncbi:MAG: NAD(P)H-binding protein [Bacteroidota bacterium]